LRQRLKKRPGGHCPSGARLYHGDQNSFHTLKIGDLCADLGKMMDSDVMHTAA